MNHKYREEEMELLPELGLEFNDYEQETPLGGSPAKSYVGYAAPEIREFENGKAATALGPKTVVLHNTELDAPYVGGNFNFLYNGGANEAVVTFNTYLSFRKNFSQAEKQRFIQNFNQAIDAWDNAAEIQVRDVNGNFNDKIKLRFKLKFVQDIKNANKRTDVHPNGTRATWFLEKGRENVMRDLNIFIGSSKDVLVHELGHVWGLLDEYPDRWVSMKFSLGHVGPNSPLLKDRKAIMCMGQEFRGRYFKHFGRAILKAFWGVKEYTIPIKQNGRTVAQTVQGRILLLKKDIADAAPYPTDMPPFNPQFVPVQIGRT